MILPPFSITRALVLVDPAPFLVLILSDRLGSLFHLFLKACLSLPLARSSESSDLHHFLPL